MAKNVYFKAEVLEIVLGWKPHPRNSFISKIMAVLTSVCLNTLSNQLSKDWEERGLIKWYSNISVYGKLLGSLER